MKYVVEAFSILIVLMLNLSVCIAVLSVSADIAAAKEYKADVIAEIENSNFNPRVMDACREGAAERGYSLEVTPCMYDPDYDRCIAEVRLTYDYEIPLLGITGQRVTKGIAR